MQLRDVTHDLGHAQQEAGKIINRQKEEVASIAAYHESASAVLERTRAALVAAEEYVVGLQSGTPSLTRDQPLIQPLGSRAGERRRYLP